MFGVVGVSVLDVDVEGWEASVVGAVKFSFVMDGRVVNVLLLDLLNKILRSHMNGRDVEHKMSFKQPVLFDMIWYDMQLVIESILFLESALHLQIKFHFKIKFKFKNAFINKWEHKYKLCKKCTLNPW